MNHWQNTTSPWLNLPVLSSQYDFIHCKVQMFMYYSAGSQFHTSTWIEVYFKDFIRTLLVDILNTTNLFFQTTQLHFHQMRFQSLHHNLVEIPVYFNFSIPWSLQLDNFFPRFYLCHSRWLITPGSKDMEVVTVLTTSIPIFVDETLSKYSMNWYVRIWHLCYILSFGNLMFQGLGTSRSEKDNYKSYLRW